ncbi:MAG: NifB/NifX family molybdenum-iron cluster-binding protein [Zhaonellaceae bacterium]
MKIAIPVNEKNQKTDVCLSFGRSPYFLIYDTETDESLFLDNTAASSTGGAGIKAAQFIIDSQVDALLLLSCGQNANQVLKKANIKMYEAINATALDNIKAFKDGELPLLNNIHPGYHRHGGN